jgi:hypothetical protein
MKKSSLELSQLLQLRGLGTQDVELHFLNKQRQHFSRASAYRTAVDVFPPLLGWSVIERHVTWYDQYVRGRCHKAVIFNPLTPKLNPYAQRCLTRFFTENLAS